MKATLCKANNITNWPVMTRVHDVYFSSWKEVEKQRQEEQLESALEIVNFDISQANSIAEEEELEKIKRDIETKLSWARL